MSGRPKKSCWSRAEIILKTTSFIKIHFLGNDDQTEKLLPLGKFEIQPEGSHTKDNFDWRFNLKPGDEIDAADNFG